MNNYPASYVIDCETTGTDPYKNDVIEVCFCRLSDNESKTWCIKPVNTQNIEEKALAVNKHKAEDILHKTAQGRETYRDPTEVVEEIEIWLMEDNSTVDERVFIGHNPWFDYDFLRALWDKVGCKDSFPFGVFIIDTLQMGKIIDFCSNIKRSRYNLGSLVKDFNIKKAVAHKADGDVKMTKDLFLEFCSMLNKGLYNA